MQDAIQEKKNQDELSILNINSSLYEIQSDHFSDYELSLNANCWKTKLVLCGLEILDNKMKKKDSSAPQRAITFQQFVKFQMRFYKFFPTLKF